MVIHDSGGNHPEKPRESFISRYLFSTDHKTIGLQYLWLALLSVFVGMAMSLVMRIHLAWPEMHIPFLSALGSSPERYATLPVLHGSLMVFLVLTAAPQLGLACAVPKVSADAAIVECMETVTYHVGKNKIQHAGPAKISIQMKEQSSHWVVQDMKGAG